MCGDVVNVSRETPSVQHGVDEWMSGETRHPGNEVDVGRGSLFALSGGLPGTMAHG